MGSVGNEPVDRSVTHALRRLATSYTYFTVFAIRDSAIWKIEVLKQPLVIIQVGWGVWEWD